jgi:predicted 2-oxoglutarate/Fe(II)-dependent dioxygenase YbiX
MFKLLMEVENNINILEERPYQNEAIFSILNFVKNLLR